MYGSHAEQTIELSALFALEIRYNESALLEPPD